MKDGQKRIVRIVLTGVFAALLVVLSQIAIPMPSGVPVTLQTFAIALCGYVLGPGMGTLAVGVYLAMGAVGLPVFAEFTGGLGIMLGVSGGFFWGFLLLALLCGVGITREKKVYLIVLSAAGLLLCHAFGVGQYALVTGTPILQGAMIMSLPYLIKDAVSVVLAYIGAKGINRALEKARLRR